MRRPARPPSNDARSEEVDDKGDVDQALPGGDIGEVRNPQPVWCWGNSRFERGSAVEFTRPFLVSVRAL